MAKRSAAEKAVKYLHGKGLLLWLMADKIDLYWFLASTPLSRWRSAFANDFKMAYTQDPEQWIRSSFNPKVMVEDIPKPYPVNAGYAKKIADDSRSLAILYPPATKPFDETLNQLIELDLKATDLLEAGNFLAGHLVQKINKKFEGKKYTEIVSCRAADELKAVEDLYNKYGQSRKFRTEAQQKTGKSDRTVLNHLKAIMQRRKENPQTLGDLFGHLNRKRARK